METGKQELTRAEVERWRDVKCYSADGLRSECARCAIPELATALLAAWDARDELLKMLPVFASCKRHGPYPMAECVACDNRTEVLCDIQGILADHGINAERAPKAAPQQVVCTHCGYVAEVQRAALPRAEGETK